MEGLYQNNLYSSSSYIMQPSDHPSYSSSSSSNYRPTASHSAFSDARPNTGYITSSPPPLSHPADSLSVVSHPQQNSSAIANNHGNTSAPYPTGSMVGWSSPGVFSWPTPISPYQQQQQGHPQHHNPSALRPTPYPSSAPYYSLSPHAPIQRPKLTTTVWEDEGTVCYQVDAKTVCVARRQDNDMINGTKLLNVVGMSRGKRDGILKNEKGRIVVKVGAMHLKGVWITFERAKDLAAKFKITELLYPLFTDDPSVFLCPSTVPGTNMPVASSSGFAPTSLNNLPMMVPSTRTINPPSYQFRQGSTSTYGYSMPSWDRSCHTDPTNDTMGHHDSFTSILRGNDQTNLQSGSCSPVPATIAPMLPASDDNDMYLMNNSYDYPSSSRSPINSLNHHQYSTHPSQQLPNPSIHPQHSKLANINTVTTSASTSSSTSSPNYDAYEYDTFFRKPMIRPPPSHATYPHSPPHEDMKYKPNPLSHTSSSANTPVSSHWTPSLISQLSDNAKTTVPPPLRQPASPCQKDDLILSQQQQQQRGRKRSIQSTSSISSPPPSISSSATVDSGHKHTIKRLRTLDN